MSQSVLTAVLLPVALGIIMLGLGLSLSLADFKRVLVYPRAVLVGLFCQMALLPLACFGIAVAFELPGPLAVGLMLLAASPGGTTANLYSHLYKGDVALNVTLTAVNSLLSLFALPFIVNFALSHFMGTSTTLPLQFDKVAQVFAIVLGPVSIGMVIRARWPSVALRLDKPVRIASAVFLVLIIAATLIKEREHVLGYFQQVGLPALVFNLASMGVGYVIPRLLRVNARQSIAIGMEVGIHNGTLAMAIALSPTLLNNDAMAIPAAVYSLIMFFTAAGFGWLVSRRVRSLTAAEAARP